MPFTLEMKSQYEESKLNTGNNHHKTFKYMKMKLHFKVKLTDFTKILIFFVGLMLFCQPIMAKNIKSTTYLLQQQIRESKVTLNLKDATLKTILQEIQKQSKINFVYKNETLSSFPKKSIDLTNVSIKEALDNIFSNSDFTYEIDDNNISISKRVNVLKSQNITDNIDVVGRVIVAGKPVVGATIVITGTTNGAITNAKGVFSLKMKPGSTIEVSFIGMLPHTEVINKANSDLVIELKEDAIAVEDVVVTGYFNRSKSSYTGNATTFTGKELRQISSSNVLNTLSMIDPSFKMNINNDFGSDPNNIPDFQIQGASNLQNEYSNTPNTPTFILDGFEVSSQKVFDMDPNRVKSITILKDASATAIYGSRAANGVVVVETISPQEGEIRVSYSFNGDFDAADLSSYNLMNASEKLQYERAAGLFTHNNVGVQEELDKLYNKRLGFVQQGIDTDWIKKPVRAVGFAQKHSLIVDGGSESFRYSIDLNYRDQNGVMLGSGRTNYGIGVKLQYNYKNIKFVNDLTIADTKSSNSPYGSFDEYSKLNPYYHPYDSDGNIIYKLFATEEITEKNMYNPMFNSTINTKDNTQAMNFSERFSIEWDAFKGFKLRAKAAIDRETFQSDNFKPNRHTSFANDNDNKPIEGADSNEEKSYKGSYEKSTITRNSYDINLMAAYNLDIDKHNLNTVVLYDIKETNSDTNGVNAYNFPNDNFDHISMGTEYKEGDRPTGVDDITRMMGVAFNANYSYDNRYLIDLSVRSDASSIFGANKRWGTFYAIGAGWNINREDFLKDSNIVNNLKLRSSFGTTGEQNFNPYQSIMMYNYKDELIDGMTYGDEIGALVMAFGNPNLKWQTTEKFNVGLDFSLFDNRLTGYLNYYVNLTKDKLIDFTVAPSTGFLNYTENLGNVENKGVEINLKGTIIRNTKNGLRWDVFVNFVSNDNKLTNINNALSSYNDKQNDKFNQEIEDNDNNFRPVVKYMDGHSINTIWGNRSLGIDPATGQEVFLDINGNRVNVYDVRNDVPLAVADPDFEGNFGTMLSYKGWNFNAYFAYSVGGYVYNQTLVDKVENVDPNNNGDKRILYDRWQKKGDIAKYKDIKNTEETKPTSRFIEQENFLRLSSISLSYQFDSVKLKKSGIEMLKVGFIGNDIFRASTVKMERGTFYPFARTFSVNMQLTF